MAEGDLHFKAYIDTDTSSFRQGIKQAQNSVTSLSNTFGGLSKVITKALSFVGITASVGAIIKFGKESVNAAESANKSFNVLNNTIRVTGATAWTTTDDIVQMSKELADSSNYAVSEIQDMQSVLLGFRNITGDTFEQASETIMDMATVMGMDLKSATQTVGKALDDPIKGLDSLRRQGFQFTDEQKAQLEQLVKNGKQLEAQKIILDELSTTYGGAARAAQSSFARMRNATTELKETLGNQLMPVINEVVNNSTNSIKQLTSEIQKIDFSRMFGIIKNIANMVKPAFEDIVNYFKEFGNEVQSLFKSDTIKPFLSVLDTVLGVLKALFNEVKSNFERVKDMFSNMKEGLGGLADSGALQNITNVINKIIDVIWFLKEQINAVVEDVKAIVWDRIKNIWNFIKQLFENSNKALEENEKGFASWAEYLWSQFDQVFKIAQDLINGVSALLHGNWAVAWEYAKLTVMRVCKVILDTISQIANSLPRLINKAVDMLNILIENLNKVRNFFGQEDIDLLKPFESVDLTESSGLGKAIDDTVAKIEELTGKAADVSVMSLKGISKASQGMASQIIGDITDVTDTYVSNSQKQYATASNTNSGIESDTENAYKKYSEWDSKLLQQRQGNLKEWQKEYHDINLKLIEEERKKALEEDKTGADTLKINQYYDNMIIDEKKRYAKAVLAVIGNGFKKVAEVIRKTFDVIVGVIRNSVNIFKKLFEFNPDEALDNLLAFEDSILTFFVETLPKLPQFFASVIQSVEVLFANLANVINSSEIANIISNIVESIAKSLPDILDSFVNLIMKVVDGIATALIKNKNKNKILNSIRNLLKAVLKLIKEVIPELLKFITEFLPELLKLIIEFIPQILMAVKDVIIAIARALPDLIPAILEALPEIISAIVEFIISELPYIIYEIIKGLVLGFVNVNWGKVVKDCFMGFINGFKKLFGIHSPSTLFEGFGKNIVQGLLNGLKGLGDMLLNVFKTAFNGIQSFFGNIQNWFSNAFSSLTDFVKNGWNNLIDNTKNLGEKLGGGLTTAWSKVKDGVSTAVEKTKEVATKVGTAFADAGSAIANGVKKIGKWLGFATGTNSAPKGLAIVGEAGPELVNFKGGEKVYNSTNTAKMLSNAGSGGNVFNVTFENTVDTTAFTMMKQLKQYQRNLAFNGVI